MSQLHAAEFLTGGGHRHVVETSEWQDMMSPEGREGQLNIDPKPISPSLTK